jgi:GT2 family glycosyltransferase
MEAVRKAGLVAERQLPHYGADNEYTLRLKRMGYPPFIAADIRIVCDMGHTGNSVYHKNPPLWERLKKTGSIKSVYNPRIRSRFICMTYPLYARPTALLMYGLKGLAEVLLGGAFIRHVFRSREHGFSGTESTSGEVLVVQGRKSI